MVAVANSSMNGQAQGLALVPQGGALAPTLLGRSAPRIPVGGRIRAGIKVLTRKAAEHKQAVEIYDKGVAEGKGFETIEREITRVLPALDHPLTPKNVPYFTVRGEDFPNPEIARQIMELFGEDREGDGERRLYRFPVVFPADAWQSVMPHEMVTWTSSERRYWSEYSADGATRFCKTHETVPVDGNGRRTIRIWGGRKTITRPENGGVCDPEKCTEYQGKKCNLSGRFIFFIPGIRSITAFELPTNSFYAMQAAIEKFQTIGFMRGGRISGFLDGQRTPFYITKRLVEVSRIDDGGKATRVPQWLIELEAPVDLTALLRPDDGLEALEMRASEAVTVLEGGGSQAVDRGAAGPEGHVEVAPGVWEAAARAGNAPNAAQQPSGEVGVGRRAAKGAEPLQRGNEAPARRNGQPEKAAAPAQRNPQGADGAEQVNWILEAAQALGVTSERFEAYANKKWGQGWKVAAGGRKRAQEDVTAFADDAEGFQKKVAGEEMFS